MKILCTLNKTLMPRVGVVQKEPKKVERKIDMLVLTDLYYKLARDSLGWKKVRDALYCLLYPNFSLTGIDRLMKDKFPVAEQEEPVWQTKNGRWIPVSQMDTIHVLNALRKIIRRETWRVDWIPVLAKQLAVRFENSDEDPIVVLVDAVAIITRHGQRTLLQKTRTAIRKFSKDELGDYYAEGEDNFD